MGVAGVYINQHPINHLCQRKELQTESDMSQRCRNMAKMDFNLQGSIIRAPSLNHKPYDSDYVCIAPSGKQDVPHRFMVKSRNFHT